MESELFSYIQPLTTWLHEHPHWAAFVAFTIAFLESLAIVGSIVPGSVTITAIGVLIGAGVIPGAYTIFSAILGAIVGDAISFWIGFYYQEHIREIWPFKLYPKLIERGERFFHKHGGKSIFIGRFFGPIRAILPLVAGMLNMPARRFLLADVISAFFWAPAYLFPGMLIGALSLEFTPKMATHLIGYVFGLLLLVLLLGWIIRTSFQWCYNLINPWCNRLWRQMRIHKTLRPLTIALQDPTRPREHGQLALGIFILFAFLGFTLVIAQALSHTGLASINEPLNYFMRSVRLQSVDTFMLLITFFGKKPIFFVLLVSIFIGLWHSGQQRTAWHWFFNATFAAVLAYACKYGLQNPRPEGIDVIRDTPSLPSGSTTLAVAIYGFLAIFLAQSLPKAHQRRLYILTAVFVGLISLSRLYLGAHWFTDVVAGILLGTGCLALSTLSLRRELCASFSLKRCATFSLSLTLFTWILYSGILFKTERTHHQPVWPTQTLHENTWWQQTHPVLPLYQLNRFGHPNAIFNLQYLGDLDTFKEAFIKNGWQLPPSDTFYTWIARLLEGNLIHHLPLFEPLYHGQSAHLTLTKQLSPEKPLLIVRLWPTFDTIQNTQKPLWIGHIHYRLLWQHQWLKRSPSPSTLPDSLTYLPSLNDDQTEQRSITYSLPSKNQPSKKKAFVLIKSIV